MPCVDVFDNICYYIRIAKVHAAERHGNQRKAHFICHGNKGIVDLGDKNANIEQNKTSGAHPA